MVGSCGDGGCDGMSGASGVNFKTRIKTMSQGDDSKSVWSENFGFSLEIPPNSIFHGPEYKEIPAKIVPIDDETIENMYNATPKGDEAQVLETQTTQNQPRKKNSAVNSLLGFLADGEMGKGSEFVVNNESFDIKKEFIAQLDTDKNGTVSEKEFMEQMTKSSKGSYYGSKIVQYSEEKAKASFNAIDKNNATLSNDGEISKEEIDNFFNNPADKDEKPFVRDENGKLITYDNVSRLKFENLPPEIKAATKTEREIESSKKILVKPAYEEVTQESKKATGHVKLSSAELYNDASHGKETVDLNANTLLNVVAKLKDIKKDITLADIYKGMNDAGISRAETEQLLKSGMTPGLQESYYRDFLQNNDNAIFKPSKDMENLIKKINMQNLNNIAENQ